MDTSSSNWDDLSSRNERLVQPPESWSAQAGAAATARWAELDSQRERLAEAGQPSPGSRSASLRLVAGAA